MRHSLLAVLTMLLTASVMNAQAPASSPQPRRTPAAAHPTGSLLQRATRILDLSRYAYDNHPTDVGREYAYDWLSNHALLILAANSVLRYNLDTHRFTRLRALTRRLNATEGAPWTAKLSPNGQLLLWDGDAGTNGEEDAMHGARIDGSHYFVDPPSDSLEKAWIGDSRHWIEFNSDDTEALVHDVVSPRKIRHLPFANTRILNQTLGIEDGVILANYHLILPIWRRSDIRPHIVVMDLARHGRVLGSFPLRFPPHAQPASDCAAARGDCIAWLLEFKRGASVRLGLWVSGADGRYMQEIGHIDMRHFKQGLEQASSFGLGDSSLRWLPDGKRLSFIYKDTLYIVPAD